MSKINWGVLGCSDFARRRSIPAMKQSSPVNLLAIASRSQEKANSFSSQLEIPRSYGSYEDLLSDPDIQAVHIVLPNELHAEWSLRALEQGKHVLCEKPSATRPSDAQRVLDKATQTGLKFMEAFMWRLHPQHEFAAQAIKRGDLGKVKLIRAALSFSITDRHLSRLDPKLGAGSLFDVGGYTISGARFYFGDEPSMAFARGTLDSSGLFDRKMAAVLQFGEGPALIDFGFDLPYRGDLEIVGENGRIYMPRAWQPPDQATIYLNDKPVEFPQSNHYTLEFDHFSNCVLHSEITRFGAADALAQSKAMDMVLESFRRNLKVPAAGS